uniref:Uncharacterized protein n=1 Tax=Quercus lobata TaxID=97700 RepID=A0A7N2R251_QUELO
MTTAKNSGQNDEGARTLLIPIYSRASVISFYFLMWELNDSIINADIIMCTNAISRWWLGLEEGNAALQSTWEAREKNVLYSCNPAQQEEFFQPLRCDSTLHICYNPSVTNQANPATSAENANGIIPGWML